MTVPFGFAAFFRALLGSALIMLGLVASPCALADDLSAALTVNKVMEGTEGRETLVSAEESKPGDILEYVARYKNESDRPLGHIQPVLPIPVGTAYENGTAAPAATEASLDGVTFQPLPLLRTVKREDGTEEQQPVPASEYRALRWTIGELAPGAETQVTARVRVLSNTGP